MWVAKHDPQKNNRKKAFDFVLLPESLACFTLAPSAPAKAGVSKALSTFSPHPIGHLRALLLRLRVAVSRTYHTDYYLLFKICDVVLYYKY